MTSYDPERAAALRVEIDTAQAAGQNGEARRLQAQLDEVTPPLTPLSEDDTDLYG